MNSITPKRHIEMVRNRNIPFQLKKQNTCRNGIDNLGSELKPQSTRNLRAEAHHHV